MELQFQRRWALRKRAQDRAVLIFFILSALLLEAGGSSYGYSHEASPSHIIQQIAFKIRALQTQSVRSSQRIHGWYPGVMHHLPMQEGTGIVSG